MPSPINKLKNDLCECGTKSYYQYVIDSIEYYTAVFRAPVRNALAVAPWWQSNTPRASLVSRAVHVGSASLSSQVAGRSSNAELMARRCVARALLSPQMPSRKTLLEAGPVPLLCARHGARWVWVTTLHAHEPCSHRGRPSRVESVSFHFSNSPDIDIRRAVNSRRRLIPSHS